MYGQNFTQIEQLSFLFAFSLLLLLPLALCIWAEIQDRIEEKNMRKLRRGNRRKQKMSIFIIPFIFACFGVSCLAISIYRKFHFQEEIV